MEKIERVEDTTNNMKIFENDIDLYLHEFMEMQGIEDMKRESQSVWNACLMYIQRHVFSNRDLLKQSSNIYTDNTIMETNCNSYNYDILDNIVNYYIYICNTNNKEVSLMGFSKLTGIDIDTVSLWGNDSNRLSTKSLGIYKKLMQEREESLSNKLADGKQNPVGVIAMLNRHYGWASPYTADSNRQKNSLPAAELPQLAPNNAQIEDKNGNL